MKAEKNILQIFKTRHFIKHEQNQKYYPYYGLETYVRADNGKGKTITAVKRIRELLKEYPEVTFITNVKIERNK